MKLQLSQKDGSTAKMNHGASLLLLNALNEVSNGLQIPDFERTIGATPEEVHTLFSKIENLAAAAGTEGHISRVKEHLN